jgi:putative ABC transport system substrate-binding protein
MTGIGRREVLGVLGGAAAWPMVARAEQRVMPVIGFLSAISPEGFADRMHAFREGLKETGYVEGDNVAIDYRWAENQRDRLPQLAIELIRRQVAVIATPGSAVATLAAKAATTTIPIVFSFGEDPVRLGLVESLARPGSNLTGINFFNSELNAKRLEILRELVPTTSRVAVLVNPADAVNAETAARDVGAAARAIGLEIRIFKASTSRELDATFATFAHERPDFLFVAGNSFFNSRRVQLVHLASYHRIPATYGGRDYPDIGGLMSYGTNIADAYRLTGLYVGRILKGAKPAELPVMQPTKFQLVINLQTARMLGLEVPPTLLARADEVIE